MRRLTIFKRLVLSQIFENPDSTRIVEIGNYEQIRDYSLVLASQSVPHEIRRDGRGPYTISVFAKDFERAQEQISLYKKENPPKTENAPLAVQLSLSPLMVLAVPAGMTLVQFSNRGSRFYHTGISDADKVLAGDWWRPITALTLHGDAHHLASNLISGYIILNLLAFRLPLSRLALPLAIASATANFFVAQTVKSDFRSLGFSTFVFCALGALSTIEFRLMPKESRGLLRRFAPLFAAALLAVFMGLGEHSDILAHFYGFLLGLGVGLLPRKKQLLWGSPSGIFDILLWIFFYAFFVIAWFRATGKAFL